MTKEQQDLVNQWLSLPHYVMKKNFPNVNPNTEFYNDMVQEGLFALCLAATRFNEDLSTFSTFAYSYCFGKMRNYYNRRMPFSIIHRNGSSYEFHAMESLDYIKTNGEGDIFNELDFLESDCHDFDILEIEQLLNKSFMKASNKYGLDILILLHLGLNKLEIGRQLNLSRTHVSRIIKKAKDIYNNIS